MVYISQSLLLAFAFAHSAAAAAVTLHYVERPKLPSKFVSEALLGTTTITALGPGESGMTKYMEIDIESLDVGYYAGNTAEPVTFLSTPWTRTYTWQEGATRKVYGNDAVTVTQENGAGIEQIPASYECNFEAPRDGSDAAKATGACSGEVLIAVETITAQGTDSLGATATSVHYSTLKTSWTGQVLPLATLTVPDTKSSAQGRGAQIGLSAALTGVFCAWFLI